MRIATYEAFWHHYLREHADPGTRRLHYAGTALTIAVFGWALAALNPWILLLAPLCGYGFAWASHAFVERNKPATFTHPLWSLASDYRMFFLAAAGKLGPHLAAAGVGRDAKGSPAA